MRELSTAAHRYVIAASRSGRVSSIDNRRISRLAKLAGAPESKCAGLELHAHLDDVVVAGQPLYTVHSEAPGELEYALNYAGANRDIFGIEDV